MLCRIWTVLGALAFDCKTRGALGYADLCRAGFAGSGAVVQRDGEPFDSAATDPRRTLWECSGMECDDVSGGDDSRSVAGRNSLCGVPWALGSLWICHGDGVGRAGFDVSHQDAGAGTEAGADDREDNSRGTAFYLAGEDGSGRDLIG